jgi:hypothetical protein
MLDPVGVESAESLGQLTDRKPETEQPVTDHKFAVGETVIVKVKTFAGVDAQGGATYVHREGTVTRCMDHPTRYEVTLPDGSKMDLREAELAALGED